MNALQIAALELRRRLRDRSALVYGLIAPLLLAGIISLAFRSGGGFEARIWVADVDRSQASAAILRGLRQAFRDSAVHLPDARSAREARRLVDEDDWGSALVFPAGFEASLAGTQPAPLSVVVTEHDPVSGGVARGIAQGIASRIDAARLAVSTTLTAGGELPPGGLAELATAAQRIRPPVSVVDDFGTGGPEIDLAAYFGPSMAVLFLFFTVGTGARSLLSEKEQGTLARVRAAPVSSRDVLVGKSISVYVVATASILSMWGATALLLGADWGDPVAVLALCLVTVLAVAGISALVAALARTAAQGEAMTQGLAFLLAVLGGNFLTPGVMTDLLERLSLLTPNGWALQGFTELSVDDGGLGAISSSVGVLAAMGAVAGVVAVTRLNRTITT